MDESMLSSVISTRIRLARNISGIPFPRKMNAKHGDFVASRVSQAFNSNAYKTYSVKDFEETESAALVERHLISKELITTCPYGGVVLSNDETISVMLNEEDHIREQVILDGYRLDDAYRVADTLDDRIGEVVNFAYSAKYGYLTACPTNLGTGMRASVMMFLPALVMNGELKRNASSLADMNITLRGVYGEGSDTLGYICQISNKRTLGVAENEILSFVRSAVESIATTEMNARERLSAERGDVLVDEIARAYGVASCAHILSDKQAIKALSLIKLGVYYGMINATSISKIDKLMISVAPFNLVSAAPRKFKNEQACNIYRAEMVRNAIKDIAELNL